MPERLFSLPHGIRTGVVAITITVTLCLVNYMILQKERIVKQGETVLLSLAPRDPRSLLQGDYMALRYTITADVDKAARAAKVNDGYIVIELSDQGEAGFVALYTGQPLMQGQRLLRFRKRGLSVRLASDAYFFEEGQWDVYAQARFGELKVSADGEAVLVGLRDDNRERLGQPLFR